MLALIGKDGGYQVRQRGSHRQFHHTIKPGTVTISGKLGTDVPPGAFVPELPGCIVAGETEEEVVRLIQEAIQFHLEDLKSEGQTIPQPSSKSKFVEVPVAA